MKKYIFLILTFTLIAIALLLFYVLKNQRNFGKYGLGVVSSSEKLKNQFCVDKNSGTKLSYKEAIEIAQKGDCNKQSDVLTTFTEKYFCNEDTGTFWIDINLSPTKEGCNPACVVTLLSKTAKINWRCTGAVPSKK